MLLPCVSSIQFAVLCGCVCLSVPNLYSDCFASCNNWHLWYDIGYKCTETLPLHQVGSPSSPFGQSPGVSLRPLPPLPRRRRPSPSRARARARACTPTSTCFMSHDISTPLCEAVFHGHVDILRLLREGYSADVCVSVFFKFP